MEKQDLIKPVKMEKKDSINKKKLLAAIVIFVLIGAAVFYRTYAFRGPTERDLRDQAELIVMETLRERVAHMSGIRSKKVPEDVKEEYIGKTVANILRADYANFDRSVSSTVQGLKLKSENNLSSDYLIGADSYYYLSLTRNIVETGKIGPERKGSKFFNPRRSAPTGNWDNMTLHPHMGFWVYRLLHFLNPEIGVMKATAYVPLIIVSLTILAYVFLYRRLDFGLLATSLGCLVFYSFAGAYIAIRLWLV